MEDRIIQINRVYNVQEAAELLGLHAETVKEYCRAGGIKSRKIGEWKILGQSLIDFMHADKPSPIATVDEQMSDIFDAGSKLSVDVNAKGDWLDLNKKKNLTMADGTPATRE